MQTLKAKHFIIWQECESVGPQNKLLRNTSNVYQLGELVMVGLVAKHNLTLSSLSFAIVIFIHYKPRIAVAILDLKWMKMTRSG